ncbi:MAG: stalk domain-containing protein [Caldisericum sp.]|uniref:stalk domain-containing protein n=1 Tax=Caldisericum sp. TaxID=2499687 RepID=UPI003D0DE837
MRKLHLTIILVFVVSFTISFSTFKTLFAFGTDSSTKVSDVLLKLQIGSSKMYVNDSVFDLHVAPEVSNGFTYIPITAISKGFGGLVEWVPDSKGIIVTVSDIKIGLQVDGDFAVLSGNVISIPPVYLKNGIPMVPLKVFTDGLYVALTWDAVNQTITMSSSKAVFDPNMKWITVIYPSNGWITPSGIIGVKLNDSITFNITPNMYSKITDVKVDGASVGAVQVYTFNNVISDHVLEAVFTLPSYTIQSSNSIGGFISPSGNIQVLFGESKTFTIVPNEGYVIKDVKVDGISIGPFSQYTFDNINSDHTIFAEFEKEFKATYITLTIGSKSATINGINTNLEVPATIIENRTYVPLRFIAEQMGCEVNWDGSQRKITINNGANKIELWIGKSMALVNGKFTPIDSTNSKVVPLISSGKTLVPIRFISESLGFYVDYNSGKKLVSISNTPIVNLDGAVGYLEKTVSYNGKSYSFKIIKIDPKVKGVKFVPSLSINGFNKGADYKTFLLPNTVVMVNGLPFDTNTFDVSGSIFGNFNGEIEAGASETFIIDPNGNCFYEEGRIEVNADTVDTNGVRDTLTTYSVNSSSYGGFTVYTNWYKDDINIGYGEVFVIINDGGEVVSKINSPTIINPSKVLKNGQFGVHAYQHSTAHWIKDTVSIFSNATYVNLRIMINGRDITNSFFVQSCPVVVKDGRPFTGADRYPDSFRMTKYGARVFIATDGGYVYFIVTPTAISLRNDPIGDIILKLGYFKYVLSLDGGGSTTLYYKDKFIYTPGRNLVTCVAVVSGNP